MELRYHKDKATLNTVTDHNTQSYASSDINDTAHKVVRIEAEKQDIYSKKLKRLRLNHLLCQKEMAVKFNISQQSYAKLESGKTLFTQKKVEKICRIFDIPFKEFIIINNYETVFNEAIDSYNLKVLKIHYESLLLQKEIKINELEIKLLQKEKK